MQPMSTDTTSKRLSEAKQLVADGTLVGLRQTIDAAQGIGDFDDLPPDKKATAAIALTKLIAGGGEAIIDLFARDTQDKEAVRKVAIRLVGSDED